MCQHSIKLQHIWKKYNREWVLKDISHTFSNAHHCVIQGMNGSGKSTLLKIISGYLSPAKGRAEWVVNNKVISGERIYAHVSLVSPYIHLFEEFSLKEAVKFHFSVKNEIQEGGIWNEIEYLNYSKFLNTPLKQFSTGMKQRVKLLLALLSDVSILLLDEPLSNVDQEGAEWYKRLIKDYGKEKLIVVCSNNYEDEYYFCREHLNLSETID